MQLNVRNRTGKVNKVLKASTNDPDQPVVVLTCAAHILAPIKFDRHGVVFGKLKAGPEKHTKTLTIERGDDGPIKPELAKSEFPGMKASIKEVKPGEKYQLSVTLGPPWPYRTLNWKLLVKTGVAKAPLATIPVYADVESRVTVGAEGFRVPRQRNKPFVQGIVIKWDDKGPPYRITRAEASDPKLQASIMDFRKDQKVDLRVPVDWDKGKSNPSVTVHTNDPDMPSIRIPVDYLRQRGRRVLSRSRLGARANASPAQKNSSKAADKDCND